MKSPSPPRLHVVAVLIATVAALFARAWLQIQLVEDGSTRALAQDISYLAVPPVLAFLLFPVLYRDREFVFRQFRTRDLRAQVIVKAIVLGILLRVTWHSLTVARAVLASNPVSNSQITSDFGISYECPAFYLIAFSILVGSVLIPFIEEITHRAYVQSYFRNRGPIVAIAISSLVFVLFHRYTAWDFVLLGGVTLGLLYWITDSLWAPATTHAVVNLVPEFTLRCMTIEWRLGAETLSFWQPGLTASLLAVVSAAGMIWLMISMRECRGN